MLTLLFICILLVVVVNIVKLAIKLAWGITKFVFSVILFPVLLIGVALAGFIYIAIAILIIVGIICLISNLALG